MNDSDTILEELSIKPKQITLVGIIFVGGTAAGVISDLLNKSTIGLIFDVLFLVMLCTTILYTVKKKKSLYLPLAVTLYQVIASFSLDIITAVLNNEKDVYTKVPIEIALIATISIAIGLFMPRIIIPINGVYTGALFFWYTVSMKNTDLLNFNFMVQPTLVGSSFAQYYFRKTVARLLIKLYGESLQKSALDLNALRITKAEYLCIQLLQKGKTTKEIAAHERCSEQAIQARLGSIYEKLNVPDRAMLMYTLGRNQVIFVDKE